MFVLCKKKWPVAKALVVDGCGDTLYEACMKPYKYKQLLVFHCLHIIYKYIFCYLSMKNDSRHQYYEYADWYWETPFLYKRCKTWWSKSMVEINSLHIILRWASSPDDIFEMYLKTKWCVVSFWVRECSCESNFLTYRLFCCPFIWLHYVSRSSN